MKRSSVKTDKVANTVANPPLLRTKLIPRPRMPQTLQRTQIAEQILAAKGAKLVLVNAPAGFGKTSVMLQYIAHLQQHEIATGWLTVDTADNDVERFMVYLASAFNTIDPTIGSGMDGNAPSSSGDIGNVAIDLANHISAYSKPFSLFIDDFEDIKNHAILDFVRQIIDILPSHGQIVIGSRNIPEIGLSRLRALGELMEIDSSQLRFTFEETTSFLRNRRGLVLTDEQIQSLHRLTEGWVTALSLASLSLRGRENPQQFIDTFSGTNVNIADYLVDDVLSLHPEHVHRFLLCTSILSELCAPMCDHVLERNDSRKMLSYIEHSHLFLEPQDWERSRYRYHALFRSFLQAQLQSSLPEAVAKLHRRASDWYLDNNRVIPSIEHALCSGDMQYLICLLTVHAEDLLWKGRARLLARWFDSPLLAAQLKELPKLALAYTWALIFINRSQKAMSILGQLQVTQDDTSGTDASISTQINALQLYIMGMDYNYREADARWRDCLDQMSTQDQFSYGMLSASYATRLIGESRFTEARDYLDEANRVHRRIGSSFMVTAAICLEGSIDLVQGRLRNAVSHFRTAIASCANNYRRYVPGSTVAVAFLAEGLYELNELDEAEKLLKVYMPLIREVLPADQLITSYVVLVRISSAKGRNDEANNILTEMESFGQLSVMPRIVATARLERSRIALLQGDVATAEDYLLSATREGSLQPNYEFVAHANDIDSPTLARLRLDVRCGQTSGPIAGLTKAIKHATNLHRYRRVLKLNILLAEALYNTGQTRMGMRNLHAALKFASGEGFIRTFVDEGTSVIRLIAELKSVFLLGDGSGEVEEDLLAFVDTVLAAAGIVYVSKATAGIVPSLCETSMSALTEKEIQVLRFLAGGYSNRTIAEKLFVSESTVKAHLRKINVKLDARSRTHALAIARKRGWVA